MCVLIIELSLVKTISGPSAAASSSNETKNSSNEPKNIALKCVLFQG